MKFLKKIKEAYNESKKTSIIVYFVLRTLVIFSMIRQILRGDFSNAFLCVLSLFLFTIPTFLQKKFKIKLPNALEIIIYLFIYAAEILGEMHNFYRYFPAWDSILHTLNGFICAGIGFSLVDLLNENSKRINLSPLYVVIVAFCFSMTIGVLWEFFEYSGDKLLRTDMQKDNVIKTVSTVYLEENNKNKAIILKDIGKTVIYDKDNNIIAEIENGYLDIGLNDTIKDLMVNLVGAITFSIIGFFYIKNREKYKFVSNFMPTKAEE